MKTTKPANSVQIEFHFDESYREKVIKRNPLDVWIELSMAVNDTDIYGGDNRNVTGIAASAMLQFLDSADPVLSGERHIIEFESGPSWLALDPRDEESINIIKCLTLREAKNPSERRDLYTPHPAKNRHGSPKFWKQPENFTKLFSS